MSVFNKVTFLVRKIFTFYINDVLLFKYPFPGPKGQGTISSHIFDDTLYPFQNILNLFV